MKMRFAQLSHCHKKSGPAEGVGSAGWVYRKARQPENRRINFIMLALTAPMTNPIEVSKEGNLLKTLLPII
jgi:hypothetical protein